MCLSTPRPEPTPNLLYHVTGPTFCAGFVVNPKGVVLKAAPILHIWRGRTLADVQGWIERAGPGKYHLRLVGPDPHPNNPQAAQAVFTTRWRASQRPTVTTR